MNYFQNHTTYYQFSITYNFFQIKKNQYIKTYFYPPFFNISNCQVGSCGSGPTTCQKLKTSRKD